MADPTFNGFSLQDSNFITEKVSGMGFGSREVVRGKVNRREGVKLIATEFGEKELTVEGVVIAQSATQLQTLLDSMKLALTAEEADLVVENGRTYRATVKNLALPEEHYNVSKVQFMITFICSDPFATTASLTVVQNVPSGVFTFSGLVNISGTLFARPVLVYTPPTGKTGPTGIRKIVISHTPTGQEVTISGFGSGTSLAYQNPVTINMDDFTSLEGTSDIDNSGAFPRWEPGSNAYTATVSGNRFAGGTMSLTYEPRYL